MAGQFLGVAAGESTDQIGQGVVVAGHEEHRPASQIQVLKALQQPLPPAAGGGLEIGLAQRQQHQFDILGPGGGRSQLPVPALAPEFDQGVKIGSVQAQGMAQLLAPGRGPLAARGQIRAQGALGQGPVDLVPLDLIGAQAGDQVVQVRHAANLHGQAALAVEIGRAPSLVRRGGPPGADLAQAVAREVVPLGGHRHRFHLGHAAGQARGRVEQGGGGDLVRGGQAVQGGTHFPVGRLQLGQRQIADLAVQPAVALYIAQYRLAPGQVQALLLRGHKAGQPLQHGSGSKGGP